MGLAFLGSDGIERAILAIGEDDLPALSFWDSEGNRRVFVAMNEDDEATITLSAKGGVSQAAMMVGPSGKVWLTLIGNEGSANFGVRLADEPVVTIFDRGGKSSLLLGILFDGPLIALTDGEAKVDLSVKRGTAKMLFKDKDQKERIRLGLMNNGFASLTVADRAENGRVQLGVTEDGTTTLGLLDADGVKRMLTAVNDMEAWLELFDADGKSIFSAP